MATLAATHPTLLDFKARLDPSDKVAQVIELLAQRNQILDDMVWVEGNELTGHQTTGHEWNGIIELNTPVPRPVWFFIAVTAI